MSQPISDGELRDIRDRCAFARMLNMDGASFAVGLIEDLITRLEQAETRLAEIAEDAIDRNDAYDRESE